VAFVVHNEHAAWASFDDEVGHDLARLSVDVAPINPADRRSRCGDSREIARAAALGVTKAHAGHVAPRSVRSRTRHALRDRVDPVEFRSVDGGG